MDVVGCGFGDGAGFVVARVGDRDGEGDGEGEGDRDGEGDGAGDGDRAAASGDDTTGGDGDEATGCALAGLQADANPNTATAAISSDFLDVTGP